MANAHDKEALRVSKFVTKRLNALAKVHGVQNVRRGANRWVNAMRAQASLSKRKAALEAELAVVSRKLR
jgi:hypothetical protein